MIEQASWIWLSAEETENAYVDFKRTVVVAAGAPLEIELSVDGNYALYCNGSFAESGQYPDYPAYKVYDRVDLTPYAQEGENEVLIRVWWPGADHFSYRKEQAGLLYALFSGETVLAVSDTATLAARNTAYRSGPIFQVTAQLGAGFEYDARREGQEEFSPACVVEKEVTLYPRPIKKLEIGARLPSVPVAFGSFMECSWEQPGEQMLHAALSARYWRPSDDWRGAEGTALSVESGDGMYLIFDLGTQQVGFPELELELPEEALVLVGWGEHLEDLRVRSYVNSRNFVFRYHGVAGRNRFFMPLRRMGLRYLQLHIYSRTATVYYAGIRPTTYPLNIYPMEIKDRLHRKIYETCVRTLQHCMHDHYEDSPWREQGLYTMDSRNEMLCGYDVFRETEFPKACLRLIGLSVREDGMAELCSPVRAAITIPSFSAVYLMQLWDYLDYSKDLDFILEMLPIARKVAEGFLGQMDPENGLLAPYVEEKYWNFYEWQEGLDKRRGADPATRTYDAPLCALVSMALQAMEKLCRLAGCGEEAARYRGAWQKINTNAERAFWNGQWYHSYCSRQDGSTHHSCELTQALMICCGACPAEKAAGVRELLKGHKELYPVTLSYSIFKYEALMTDPANLQWVMDDVAEIWGTMLFRGATTFWETADGASAFRNAGSLCHGWSAVPLHLYHKYGQA